MLEFDDTEDGVSGEELAEEHAKFYAELVKDVIDILDSNAKLEVEYVEYLEGIIKRQYKQIFLHGWKHCKAAMRPEIIVATEEKPE